MQISEMKAEIEEEEEHVTNIIDRVPQGFVITTLSVTLINIKGLHLDDLLDSDTEVSIIIKKLMDQLGLIYTGGSNISISGVTESLKKFLRICENVPISINRLTYHIPY